MASISSQAAQHFELEANQKMRVFELDGANCAYDQDEWLGLHVWELFIKAKFIESNPKAGLSPGASELSRTFSRRFNFIDAINHIVEANPDFQAEKLTLLKALGLAARNMSLSPTQIIAWLSLFYQREPITLTWETPKTPTSSQETETVTTDSCSFAQPVSFNGEDSQQEQHICEDHMYTSALKRWETLRDFRPRMHLID